MKRILILLLLVFSLAFASCGKKNDKPVEPDDGGQDPAQEVEVDKALDASLIASLGCKDATEIFLTTCGQSDVATVANMLDDAGVPTAKIKQEELITAREVITSGADEKPLVLLVVGTSSKGLGNAGTDVAKETKRAQDFAQAHLDGSIRLVIFHVGGAARRGSNSDPVINAACKSADLLLVVEEGNSDGLFTNLAKDNSIPLYLYSKASKMAPAISKLFK